MVPCSADDARRPATDAFAMNEIALERQRTVDRIAVVGSAIAMLTAAAFVALDPVQTVSRHPSAAARQPAATLPVAATPDRSPLVQLSLPSPAWTVVSDGTWAVYARLEQGEPATLVARSLHSESSRVVYQAAASGYLGQLSLADGIVAFEEVTQPNGDGTRRTMAIKTLSIATGAVTVLDTYAPNASLAASPVTDGARVFWTRPAREGGDEIREFDRATASSSTLSRSGKQIAGLALSGTTLAYTAFAGDEATSYVLDLATGASRPVDGFAYSYVQSVGPDGVVVTAAPTPGAAAASWLVRADGTRTRLGSECFNVTMTARLLAMRCATQIEIRDLATGSSLYHFAGNAGALSVFENGVVGAEGDELVLYELPALADRVSTRPE
jgi:hypothetical protein